MLGNARVVATVDRGRYVWTIYGLLMMHAFCYQLQVPLEPYLVDHLIGESGSEATALYGYLQSFYQVVQLVGSIAFGGFLDRYGCRKGLMVSYMATALHFFVLANTSSVALLFLSKVPGLLSHPFLSCQTAISQLTPDGPERGLALGRLVTAFTLGGMIGPAAGGWLGEHGGFFLSPKIAVVGSLISLSVSSFLPARMERDEVRADAALVVENGAEPELNSDEPKLLPWRERAALMCSLVGPMVGLKLVMFTVSGMTKSADTVVMKSELGLSKKQLGTLMSLQFAFMAFNSGVLLGPLTRCLGGKASLVVARCLPIVALAYIGQAALRAESLNLLGDMSGLHQTYIFLGVTMFAMVFRFSMSTSITAESTQIVPKEMKGTLLGLEHCMYSASRIVSPTLGITLLRDVGSSALYAMCAAIPLALLLPWIAIAPRFLPDRPKKAPGDSEAKAAVSVQMRRQAPAAGGR